MPAATEIVDAGGNVWTEANGLFYLNGVDVTGSATQMLLYYNGNVYARNSDNTWWEWNGGGWSQIAGNPQPTSTGGTTQTSANGTTMPAATEIVDAGGNVWTEANGLFYRNGVDVTGSATQMLLYYNGNVYARNSDNTWWEWNGGGWSQVAGDPQPTSTGGTTQTSANGTTMPAATEIVDAGGNVWTEANGLFYRNGVDVTGSATQMLLYYNGNVYARNSDNTWWEWNGSGWSQVAGDPEGVTAVNGVCGAANGTTTSAAPTTNLCSAGTPYNMTGSGPWTWSCVGLNGGTTAQCQAAAATTTADNGQCGSAAFQTVNVAPTTNLCAAGTASAVTGGNPWHWSCSGTSAIAYCQTLVPAYYVATDGNDKWSGTLPAPNSTNTDGPFATLHKAQTAMEASSTRTTYIRAGTYTPASVGDCGLGQNGHGEGLILGASDSGETWAGYPGDPPLSAIIDGGSTSTSTGLVSGACVRGGLTAPITFTNLTWQHFDLSAIYTGSPIVVTDSAFTEWTWIQGTALDGGAILVDGSATPITSGYQIENNYFHDSYGDAVELVASAAGAVSNSVIANNVVLNTCASTNLSSSVVAGDCGALYVGNPVMGGDSSNIQITNNYIRDVFKAGGGVFNVDGGNAGIGIYLDNVADNVTISGNVITGIMNAAFFIHGGSHNHITGNIYDESATSTNSSSNPYILIDQSEGGYYGSANTGNTLTNNIIVSGGSTGGGGYRGFSATASPTIQDNAYYNYVGSTITSTGGGGVNGDSNPIRENPDISCWAPTIAGGSPVFNSPVSFPGIAGGWGPPGFVIPETGTAPSWPHGC